MSRVKPDQLVRMYESYGLWGQNLQDLPYTNLRPLSENKLGRLRLCPHWGGVSTEWSMFNNGISTTME